MRLPPRRPSVDVEPARLVSRTSLRTAMLAPYGYSGNVIGAGGIAEVEAVSSTAPRSADTQAGCASASAGRSVRPVATGRCGAPSWRRCAASSSGSATASSSRNSTTGARRLARAPVARVRQAHGRLVEDTKVRASTSRGRRAQRRRSRFRCRLRSPRTGANRSSGAAGCPLPSARARADRACRSPR